MLEHLPRWLGALLKTVRAGHAKLVIVQEGVARGDAFIELSSPAFADGARLPVRFTADGEGVSPPLNWGPVPDGTHSLALIVEDPDAPTPSPLVHALVWNLPPTDHALVEGAIGPAGPSSAGEVGRNSYFVEGWLPPDPPTGHGTHDYVFQLFALSAPAPGEDAEVVGRSDFVAAIDGRVLAAGMLVGTYSREEPAELPNASARPAVA